MQNKLFKDFEKKYIEDVKDRTIGELIAEFSSSDMHILFDLRDSIMELKELGYYLEDSFFKTMFKKEEFLDLPIIAIAKDHEDRYCFAIEEVENGYFKTLLIDNCKVIYSIMLISAYEKVSLGYKTIRDLVNNPIEGIDLSDYLK